MEDSEFSITSLAKLNSISDSPEVNSLHLDSARGFLDDDYNIFIQKDMYFGAFQEMDEIRRKGKLCDVTIKVADNCYTAHKIVLASVSPYFKGMFLHDTAESKQKEITIQGIGIEPEAFQSLINFAYSGKIKIDKENVQNLLIGSSYLQICKVRDACEAFLAERLTPHNVLGIRNLADKFAFSFLVESTNRYVQKYFVEVAQSDEFHEMDFEEVQEIISRDQLNVPNEEVVFEATISWVKKELDIRSEHLPYLLSKIRMPLLTPQYLTDKVGTESLIRTSHECRDLLDEARDYHLMPERRCLLNSDRTKPRCCNDVIGLIYAVGGGESLRTVEFYNPIIDCWQITEGMTTRRSRVGVAVLKGKLYAIGGYDGNDRLATVERFNCSEKLWQTVSSMLCKRSALGAAVLNNHLYVCGGYDGVASLNTVEQYDIESDKWTMVKSMCKHRSAAGVVNFDGHIYAIGGHDGLSIFDTVERYNPSSNEWEEVPSMLHKRCRLGAAILSHKLYVCGGYDGSNFLNSVEVYDPVENSWSSAAPMNVARGRVALCSNMGKLYAIGGYDGVSRLPTAEVYDPSNNAWNDIAPMRAHEGGVGVGVIHNDWSETWAD